MSKKITIPISDHDNNCTMQYYVEYKLASDAVYSSFTALSNPVVISNILDDAVYNVRITRNCCDGNTSSPLTLTIDTSDDSPILDTPTGFSLTPGDEEIAANCDDVTDAEHYIWEIAQDVMYTLNYQMFMTTVSNRTITELTNGTLYYVRVRATASAFVDSARVSGTVTPV